MNVQRAFGILDTIAAAEPRWKDLLTEVGDFIMDQACVIDAARHTAQSGCLPHGLEPIEQIHVWPVKSTGDYVHAEKIGDWLNSLVPSLDDEIERAR